MVKLGGRYEVLAELGGHGLVRVFRVRDVVDGHQLLVKTMPVTPEQIEDFLRFQEEGALITSLDHPNIWKVYSTFIDEGVSCIVLEDVIGQTLAELMRRGRMALAQVKSIALQLASALAYGHARGIVHRDLEPENVVITAGDVVKLRAVAELGMARVARGAAIPMASPSPRSMLYASPEQREERTVGPQTDIFSLGALMFHMVNGIPPFDEAHGGMRFVEGVPTAWQGLIARAMARNERYRFASAVEMGEAIATLPAPGSPPMRFEAPQVLRRCSRCDREARGQFCPSCGAPVDAG